MSTTTYRYHPDTTVYEKAPLSPSDTPKTLVFIPGNPGLIDFYTTYLNLIQLEHPDVEIFAISHAGYKTTDGGSKQYHYYDLAYQVSHKHEIIRKHLLDKYNETGKSVELWIMGHSMGGFVGQRVIKELLKDKKLSEKFELKFVGFICPTIDDIRISSSGKKFIFLFRWFPVISIMLWVVRFINLLSPSSKRKLVLGKYPGKVTEGDDHHSKSVEESVSAMTQIISSENIVHQALDMSREEFVEVIRDDVISDWFFKELPPKTKIWVFFAHWDHWVADSSRDRLIEVYHNPSKNVVFEVGDVDVGIKHAFCVHQSVEFAKITLAQMAEFKL